MDLNSLSFLVHKSLLKEVYFSLTFFLFYQLFDLIYPLCNQAFLTRTFSFKYFDFVSSSLALLLVVGCLSTGYSNYFSGPQVMLNYVDIIFLLHNIYLCTGILFSVVTVLLSQICLRKCGGFQPQE